MTTIRELAVAYFAAELAFLSWDSDDCRKHMSEAEARLFSAVASRGGSFTDPDDGLRIISHEVILGGTTPPHRYLRFECCGGALDEARHRLPMHLPTWRRGILLALAVGKAPVAVART